MDNNSRNPHLGVNKIGKNIRKSPLHQPNYPLHRPAPPPPAAAAHLQPPPAPPQPQVYNISKSDFRSIVQQLTGTPSRDPAAAIANSAGVVGSAPNPPTRPPHPKPPSMRLQKIRPPPLTPIARPPPPPFQNPNPNPNFNPNPSPIPNPQFYPQRPVPPPGAAWADSPVSAYMRYLESSLLSADSARHAPPSGAAAAGLLPSPGFLGHGGPPFPSPRSNPNPNPNPNLYPPPPNHPPGPPPNHPGLLPSPTSQFLNLLSPKSPYPLLSPGFQYPPPLTPNFAFSPLAQSGILGPGPGPQPPPSPGLMFPPSPSGFLPLMSPRWREM